MFDILTLRKLTKEEYNNCPKIDDKINNIFVVINWEGEKEDFIIEENPNYKFIVFIKYDNKNAEIFGIYHNNIYDEIRIYNKFNIIQNENNNIIVKAYY